MGRSSCRNPNPRSPVGPERLSAPRSAPAGRRAGGRALIADLRLVAGDREQAELRIDRGLPARRVRDGPLDAADPGPVVVVPEGQELRGSVALAGVYQEGRQLFAGEAMIPRDADVVE